MTENVVPGTSVDGINPLSIIPAANLAPFAGVTDPAELARLTQLQKDLQRFTGGVVADQGDVVMVNPHGRIVEISGEMVTEYLAKPGFRAANADEENQYRRSIIRQTPEYLRRLEKRRLAEQTALLDSIEEEDFGDDDGVDLQRAAVLPGQATGAPIASQATPVAPKPAATQVETKTEDEAVKTTAKPRSRKSPAKTKK